MAPSDAYPPLKRHDALQPLSREHMNGLIQARRLTRAARADGAARLDAVRAFVVAWTSEIRDHFDDEERMLLPLPQPEALRRRLLDEHAALRSSAARCVDDPRAAALDPHFVAQLGSLLHDHIRWEERHYFQFIQHEHPAALDALLADADAIQRERPGARARRKLDPSSEETNL
jgi:hemerythrin-like domain-containing protein